MAWGGDGNPSRLPYRRSPPTSNPRTALSQFERTPDTPAPGVPEVAAASSSAAPNGDDSLSESELESGAGGDVLDWVIGKVEDWYESRRS